MKKNIFTLVIAVLVCCTLMLSGCSDKKKAFSFDEGIMTLSDGTSLSLGSHLEIDTESAVIKGFVDGETVLDKDVSLNGIKVGSTAKDFISAFGLEKNYAMWETYLIKGADETIVNYDNFTGGEIAYGSYDDRFLTVGYLLDIDGKWKTMHIETLKTLWDLKAGVYDFGKIAIISAGFDPSGVITTLIADYGEYSGLAAYYGE